MLSTEVKNHQVSVIPDWSYWMLKPTQSLKSKYFQIYEHDIAGSRERGEEVIGLAQRCLEDKKFLTRSYYMPASLVVKFFSF